MVQLGGADDRRRDDGFGEQPRQRNLCPRNAPRRGNLGYAIDDLPVCFLLGGAKRQHFPLLLAVEEVHQILHADKTGPAVPLGDSKSPRELPGMHRGPADITSLPGLDDVVQCLKRLLDRAAIVPAVDLIEIDVIGAEASKAVIDLAHDRHARQAAAVRPLPHPPVDLGRDDDLVAAGQILDRPAEDLLAAAEGMPVRRVEEIDAALESPLDERATLRLVDAPGMIASFGDAIAHAAEADPRHLQTRAAELYVLHHSIS